MVSAIVLAAGESRRMGRENKLLLPFGNKVLIEHIVDTVLASDASEVIVVTGHEADQVRHVLKGRPLRFAQNDRYAEGMTTSIQAGVRAASAETDGLMICLSDQPFIQAAEYSRLVQAFETVCETAEQPIVMPTFKEQRGNPVIFSVYYQTAILRHQEMQGCRGIVKQNAAHLVEVAMPTDHVVRDIDTQEDYTLALGLT